MLCKKKFTICNQKYVPSSFQKRVKKKYGKIGYNLAYLKRSKFIEFLQRKENYSNHIYTTLKENCRKY